MDEDQLNEQTAEEGMNSFLSGFNEVRPDDAKPLPEQKIVADPVVEQKEAPAAAEPEGKSNDAPEEPLFAGMTESQIKSLLERSARVDEIENQLRRAHGKIGELNANLQNLSHQRPTQSAPAEKIAGESDPMAEEFPEVVAIARRIAEETMQANQPSAPAADQPPAIDRNEIEKEINLAVMDSTQKGWRETVSSQDFALWIATQPTDVQQTFNTTISAATLTGVIQDFKNWKTNVDDRSTRNKKRLEDALLPTGNPSKVSHAPSANDEFLAGFNAVRSQT